MVDGVVEILAAPESSLREEGVASLVELVLATKLRDAVDLRRVHATVSRALTRENVARDVTRRVRPGWKRYESAVKARPTLLGELVPDDARAALRALLSQPSGARAKWARGAVDPALLKRLLAPVWVQLLSSFARKFVGSAGGSSGGESAPSKSSFVRSIGRSVQQRAERLVDVGRNALEGLGIDIEQKLSAAAREFSEGALSIWNQALRDRLQSDEGKQIIAQIKLGVLEHVLRVPLAELQRDADALPIDPIFELSSAVIAHAARHELVQAIVLAELDAFMAEEGERTLTDVLSEVGALDEVRALLVTRFDQTLKTWAQSDGFAAWLERLLAAAQKTS
jgi:hypothetical protein